MLLDLTQFCVDGEVMNISESLAIPNLVKSTYGAMNFGAKSAMDLNLTGCILFNVTGPDFVYAFSDCSIPSTAFWCTGMELPPGEYTVTAQQCFPECVGAVTTKTYFVSNSFGVEDFTFYDVTLGVDIPFRETYPTPSVQIVEDHIYNIRAVAYGEVGSVFMSVSDSIEAARVENFFPFDSFGTVGSLMTPGNYTVIAQPFADKDATGEAGGLVEFTFEAYF